MQSTSTRVIMCFNASLKAAEDPLHLLTSRVSLIQFGSFRFFQVLTVIALVSSVGS